MLHFRTPLVLAALAALLSACGGGGGGSSPIPSTGGGSGSSPTQPAQSAPASMVIYIPPPTKQNTHFRPNYISAGTQSMTVGLVSGSTTSPLVTINLTTSSPNCTVPTGGGLQCTATVQAPFGTDTFAVSTYSATNAGGSVLSTGQVQVTLTRGGTEPTVQLDLDGVPVSVALVLGTATLPVGYAGSTSVIVQAKDASGNLIIGPGLFATPISLAISGDTYGTLALSSNSVTSPGQAVTLNYNGGTNVGATVTPSGSGISGTSASFNATGAVLNLFQYFDSANDVSIEPYALAALPNGTAAVVGDVNIDDCCEYSGITITAPTAVQSIFVGETQDFYNPTVTASPLPGVTAIANMSSYLQTNLGEDYAAYDAVATANGIVYYSGETSSNGDAPNCTDNELETGTIGALNVAMHTTTEHVLSGYPSSIKVDPSGNVWFIEAYGTCGESNLLGEDDYAIGEMTPGGTITETPFSTAGLSGDGYPTDMTLSPNGSLMYINDEDSNVIYVLATAKLSGPQSITLQNSSYPYGIATASDGTVAWSSDNEPSSDYYYGYISGGNITSLGEAAFPIANYYSYTVAQADNSFWLAGPNDEASGIGRISGLSTPANPLTGYYAPPTSSEEGSIEMFGVAAGGGYVWTADPCQGVIYALQYGAPASGTITYTSHRIGTISYRSKSQMHKRLGHRFLNPHPRRPVQRAPITVRGVSPPGQP